jgi:hypothetical protein
MFGFLGGKRERKKEKKKGMSAMHGRSNEYMRRTRRKKRLRQIE